MAPSSPSSPKGLSLFRLNFLWPLSFDAVDPATEFDAVSPEGNKLTSISYTPSALVATFNDGSSAYREGGSYSWSAPLPLSQYIDPAKYPVQAVAAGSLHFVGLTRKGRLVSSKSRAGEKAVRLLEHGQEPPAAAVAAGTYHALAVTEAGGLLAWAVEDSAEARAAVAPFSAVQVGSMPLAAGAAGQAVVPLAPRRWHHSGISHGRVRVVAASAGSVHSLMGLSDGGVWVAGIKASQRFSRNTGTSTTYVGQLTQIKLPVKARSVLLAEACGADDMCVVATDAGVVCWADDRTKYQCSESGWSAEYAPAPRHLKQLDKIEIKQIALSEAYTMAAALAADGRIFLWCVKLSEKSWPAEWLEPALAATAPGAVAIGWSHKDLYVAMPAAGAAAAAAVERIALAAPRPQQQA